MIDAIDHLYQNALQDEAEASDRKWLERYAHLSEVGISALPCDLLGDQWRHGGWREMCRALTRMVGQLSKEVAELKKERQ